MCEASPVGDHPSTHLSLSLISLMEESGRSPQALFPLSPSENVRRDCHHYWLLVLFQEMCDLFLPAILSLWSCSYSSIVPLPPVFVGP